MNHLIEILEEIFKNTAGYASVVSVVMALAGSLATIFAKTLAARSSQRHAAETSEMVQAETAEKAAEQSMVKWFTQDSASPSFVARGRVVARISEAATSRQKQLAFQKSSKAAANSLTVSQYIIGGVLASSFVQQSIGPNWIGGLGVVVLIASLVKQHYHPEIGAEDARKKASMLQALVRSSEDQLAILDAQIAAGQDHPAEMIALLTQVTQRLTEIENPEALEATPPPGTV